MENLLPNYKRPLKSTEEPSIETKYWDEAKEAFDNKAYKQSLIAVINYLNSNVLKKVNTKDDINITQMHGSAEINIRIDETMLNIRVPFLKITENTNEIALLRKVAEVNFSRFDLAQISLDEDKLTINYEVPLELCQPFKIYTVLREICFRADEFDDEFIEKYGAVFYKEPKRTPLSEKEKEKVWLQIDNVLDEYEKYSIYFKEKQWDGYQWDMGVISLLKIANMPYVNGTLRHELMEQIDLMYNGDNDFTYRVEKGRNYIKKLSSMSKQEFMDNVYHSEQFISMLWKSSAPVVAEKMESYLETVEKYNKDENSFAASYFLQGIFLKLIYNYHLEENYKNVVEDVLEKTSNLSPEEAAPKLLKVYYAMHTQTLNAQIDEFIKPKKSFWDKLSTTVSFIVVAYLILKYFIQG